MPERFLSLADAVDVVDIGTSDGARLPVYEAGGAQDSPALLVGHANGLAGGSYAPWLRALTRDFRVFAFDARGHGGSSWPEGPLETVFSIDRLADDLREIAAALRSRLGARPLHYAGHSLSAAAAVRIATRGECLPFDGITLFEPPIFPPKGAPISRAAACFAPSCRRCWRLIAGRRSGPTPPAAVSFAVRRRSKARSSPCIGTPIPGSACPGYGSASTSSAAMPARPTGTGSAVPWPRFAREFRGLTSWSCRAPAI